MVVAESAVRMARGDRARFQLDWKAIAAGTGTGRQGKPGEKTCFRSLSVISIPATVSGAGERVTFGSRFASIFSPLLVLVVFFATRKESHHSFRRSMDSTEGKDRKENNRDHRGSIHDHARWSTLGFSGEHGSVWSARNTGPGLTLHLIRIS